ncbi:ABC-2 type transporter-domain-containing protein [Melampsora americana]|nr:ABC-2 type transporter-domain-containing protein [Melampsora americana]
MDDGLVDIKRAQTEFGQVQLQMSEMSASKIPTLDLSDKEAQADDGFDLLKYLRGERQAMDSRGFLQKRIGVIFSNLGVSGMGGERKIIKTFPYALRDHLLYPFLILERYFKKRPTKMIISGFNGCVFPGEMCLVLGRPNSGCSTFLKVVANQRIGFTKILGTIKYAGIEAQAMAKQYKGEVVYNPEDDVHHPTLTVGQTLEFALRTKTPATRLIGQTEDLVRERVLVLLLRMLGIFHTKETCTYSSSKNNVGNAHVRGVSGGERKRVSIAEMMTTQASVLSWDNSTRGLDASSALQYAKSLRILSNVFQKTMFVTLYQAGERIYEQFDKVCLINEGRQVYFGPTSLAREYMMGLGYKDLPRQSTADYLTGCTDPNERQFADNIDPATVPQTPEEMANAYHNSEIYQRVKSDIRAYSTDSQIAQRDQEEFFRAVDHERSKFASRRSSYTASFCTQIRALMIREFQLKRQDRVGLILSWVTTVALSIFVGSLFLALPVTSSGAFTRGGVLYLSVLFNVFVSFTELPSQMIGRPIMWRQTSFCFYRGGALALANIFADVPFSISKNFVFCTILYLMTGLVRSWAAFFTFNLIVYITSITLSTFFSFLGAISFSFDTAGRTASLVVMTMVMYSGYMIPQTSMRRFLVWAWYINPINYSFGALMANEFSRLNLSCEGRSIIPNGPGYPAALGPNQVCTLQGARPGEPLVRGEDYIQAAYDYSSGNIWRNVGIEIGFFLVFSTFLFLALENLSKGTSTPSLNLFVKENKERRYLNERLRSRKKDKTGSFKQDFSAETETKSFTWEGLTYDVKTSRGKKRLLDNIYGYVKSGTLTALMGASGAGKTTLLDVLANRKTEGFVEGHICISGKALGPDFQRGTGYCEQQDVHECTATVREAFRFSAYLRQPGHVSIEDKDAFVEEVIQLLEMEDLADAIIGFPGFGLGVEARKKLTIGVELAAKPQSLLFLDEPTSGLDAQSAHSIIRILQKLAETGQAILCTIHQPNALLFESFDRLLLLNQGGRCVYFGDVGRDSRVVRSYFEKNGARCPDEANPAEFILEAIGVGNASQMGGKEDWTDRWLKSKEYAETQYEIRHLKQATPARAHERLDLSGTDWVNFGYQLKTVLTRTNRAYFRNADYQLTRLHNHVSIGLLVGLSFLNLPNSVAAVQYRIFSIFVAGVLPALIISQVEPSFISARLICIRELSSKTYAPEVFAISQFLAELSYSTICAVLYYLLWYFLTGMNPSTDRAGYSFLMIWVWEIFSFTLGQAIAALSPSIFIASQVNAPLCLVLSLISGIMVPQPVMPKFWRSWLYYLNPYTRLISGLVVNELHDLDIRCRENEFAIVQPPINTTCGEWLSAFVATAGGYVKNTQSTENCAYCQFSIGDEYLTTLDYSYSNRWREIGIMPIFCVFNVCVTVLAAKFLTVRYAHR